MAQPIKLRGIEFSSVRVTERTKWTFAEIFDHHGASALVEVTCGDSTGEVVSLLQEFLTSLKSIAVATESKVVALLGLSTPVLRTSFPLATAVSALRTAIVGLQCAHDGVSMTEALGGEPQQSVSLYANINRCLLLGDRSPSDFAKATERAARDGFTSVKCAPFDEVHPPANIEEIANIARPGIERVAAVRQAVGPAVRVLVDCHSRFEAHTAPVVAEELAELDVGWFEEPLQPTKDIDGLAGGRLTGDDAGRRWRERLRRGLLCRPCEERSS